jgi:hypothetical protein
VRLESRIARLERELGGPGSRVAYSHAQLVALAWARLDGATPDEAVELVGLPEDVLAPGEKSYAEIAEAAARRTLAHAAAPAPA